MSAEATTLETKARPWWVMLIEGIVLTIVGAVLLWSPAKTKLDTYSVLVAPLGPLLDRVRHHGPGRHVPGPHRLGLEALYRRRQHYRRRHHPDVPHRRRLHLPKIFVLVLGIWGVDAGDHSTSSWPSKARGWGHWHPGRHHAPPGHLADSQLVRARHGAGHGLGRRDHRLPRRYRH